MKRPLFFVLTAIALATLLLMTSACDSIDNGHPGDPDIHGGGPSNNANEITVSAADFAFDPAEITIPAGESVAITLQNEDVLEHDLQVDGLTIERLDDGAMPGGHAGGDASTLALHTTPDESATLTFRATQTGTFEFYCTITGHREEGMVGTLTVE